MKKGDFIRINYIGRTASGEIFDLTYEDIAKKEGIHNSSVIYKPVPVIVGAGFVIKGLDKELESMSVGEKKVVRLPPEEAFGRRDPKLVKIVNKKVFRDEPKVGMVVDFRGAKGRIQSIDGGRVRIDFNNPLAGKEIEYEVEIVEKVESLEEKVRAAFEFFGSRDIDVSVKDGTVEVRKCLLSVPLKQKLAAMLKEHADPSIKNVRFIEEY